jgi:SAM-dependent methyltransferase
VGTTLTFGPLAASFLDAESLDATPAGEIAWYSQRLPADAGIVLDLMCGNGRLLVPLLAYGYKLHGVDHAPAMLALCELHLASRQLSAPLFRQDVTQMNLPFRYGAAFVAGGAFQYITDPAAALGALLRTRAHLVAPGHLIIDCRVPAQSVQRLGAPLVEVRTAKLADGTLITLRSETTWWADARLMRSEHRYVHRDGTKHLAEEHASVTQTWYPAEEMTALVREAGFRDIEIGSSPHVANDEEAYAVQAYA